MDAPTIRAACPNCQAQLRIPAAWAGQVVKCKKCGSAVRVRAHGDGSQSIPRPNPIPQPVPLSQPASPFTDMGPAQAPRGHAFEAAPAAGYSYPPPGYPYPMPAGYPQPVPVQSAVPGPAAFTPSEATASRSGGRRKYRRGPDRMKYVWIGVTLLVTAGLVAGGVYVAKQYEKNKNGTGETAGIESRPGSSGQSAGKSPNPLAQSQSFPRRLLFIHISNYLYLNPLTGTSMSGQSRGPDLTRSAAIGLAYEWRIPRDKENDQLFLLSDTASPPDNRLPMRDVLVGTYEKFFATSRTQDRIMVYFGGHVLTIEGKTYLVPIEGDPDEPDKLIPLADFYARMQACPATQKVVIWDVCRYNPERGRSRPGSDPMSAETAKALAATPEGVQAVLTCQADENAFEFYNAYPDGAGPGKRPVSGSSFLAALRYLSDKNRRNAKEQQADDPLPVAEWTKALAQRVAEVGAAEGKAKQTVAVLGTRPETLVAANKEEAPATRFEYPPSPKSAHPEDVASIASEINLPGIKRDDGDSGIAGFPFPEEALAPYKADVPLQTVKSDPQKYPFRIAVLDAFETIRKVWQPAGADGMASGVSIREEFEGSTTDAIKKEISKEQDFPARGTTLLRTAIGKLERVAEQRATQPKRWQANYDYALAQCKARYAWLNEYDLALGSIRTEVLPAFKPGQNAYRLVSREKMKVKSEAKEAEEAKELYQQIITEFKGSPWAIQAKRDKAQSLGLAWQPFTKGSADPPAQ